MHSLGLDYTVVMSSINSWAGFSEPARQVQQFILCHTTAYYNIWSGDVFVHDFSMARIMVYPDHTSQYTPLL